MTETRISGSVTADGKASSSDFTVTEQPELPGFAGRRVWRVQITGLRRLAAIEALADNESRDDSGPRPSAFSVIGLAEFSPPSPTFVVVAGYTRITSNRGHHGFAFVAVGDAPG